MKRLLITLTIASLTACGTTQAQGPAAGSDATVNARLGEEFSTNATAEAQAAALKDAVKLASTEFLGIEDARNELIASYMAETANISPLALSLFSELMADELINGGEYGSPGLLELQSQLQAVSPPADLTSVHAALLEAVALEVSAINAWATAGEASRPYMFSPEINASNVASAAAQVAGNFGEQDFELSTWVRAQRVRAGAWQQWVAVLNEFGLGDEVNLPDIAPTVSQ